MDIHALLKKSMNTDNEEFIAYLSTISEVKSVDKGQILINADETPESFSILIDGIFRGYVLEVNGYDFTDGFFFSPGTILVGGYRLKNMPGINIEALTRAHVLSFHTDKILPFFENREFWPLQVYILTGMIRRYRAMKILQVQYDAMQRYQWFLKEYPTLINQVSNRYVASFLGMTPVTLSRLRRQLREQG